MTYRQGWQKSWDKPVLPSPPGFVPSLTWVKLGKSGLKVILLVKYDKILVKKGFNTGVTKLHFLAMT